MCDDASESKRRVPYAFLDDIKERFRAAYGDASKVVRSDGDGRKDKSKIFDFFSVRLLTTDTTGSAREEARKSRSPVV
jgi:hypothetical protein